MYTFMLLLNADDVLFMHVFSVPSHIVGKADLDKSKLRTNLSNFNYTCLGYSIYLDNKNISANSHKQVSKFPICVAGLEVYISTPFSS